MNNSPYVRLLSFIAAASLLSCAMKRYDASLHIENMELLLQVKKNTVKQHEPLVVTLILTNNSTVPMKVYYRKGRSAFTFKGSSKTLSLLSIVDHPTPNQIAWLSPNESISWQETPDVMPVGTGPAMLGASIEIYHPNTCDRYGCDYVTLLSKPINIEIEE